MREFDDLVAAIRLSMKKCPWMREQTIESYKHQLVDEAHEVLEAIDAGDDENLKEELGDIIYDALCLAIMAESQGKFSTEGVISTVTEKIKRRKPWVFGDVVISTPEEAVKMWNEIKHREKESHKLL